LEKLKRRYYIFLVLALLGFYSFSMIEWFGNRGMLYTVGLGRDVLTILIFCLPALIMNLLGTTLFFKSSKKIIENIDKDNLKNQKKKFLITNNILFLILALIIIVLLYNVDLYYFDIMKQYFSSNGQEEYFADIINGNSLNIASNCLIPFTAFLLTLIPYDFYLSKRIKKIKNANNEENKFQNLINKISNFSLIKVIKIYISIAIRILLVFGSLFTIFCIGYNFLNIPEVKFSYYELEDKTYCLTIAGYGRLDPFLNKEIKIPAKLWGKDISKVDLDFYPDLTYILPNSIDMYNSKFSIQLNRNINLKMYGEPINWYIENNIIYDNSGKWIDVSFSDNTDLEIDDKVEKIKGLDSSFNYFNINSLVVSENNPYFKVKDGILYNLLDNEYCKAYVPKKLNNTTITVIDEPKIDFGMFIGLVNKINIDKYSKNIHAVYGNNIAKFIVDDDNNYYSTYDDALYNKNQTIIIGVPYLKEDAASDYFTNHEIRRESIKLSPNCFLINEWVDKTLLDISENQYFEIRDDKIEYRDEYKFLEKIDCDEVLNEYLNGNEINIEDLRNRYEIKEENANENEEKKDNAENLLNYEISGESIIEEVAYYE